MSDNHQKQVFEKEAVWADMVAKQGEIERSQITVNLIPKDVKSALDAGCGSGIITNKINAERVVGLDFSRTALKLLVRPAVEGNLLSLPFPTQSFDIVVCSEILEHISHFDYDQVLGEISRVSRKYLLVSVPCRENLKRSQVICPACGCSFQPYYHMRSYQEKSVRDLFTGHGFAIKHLTTLGQKRDYIGLTFLIKLLGATTFPKTTVCPQCGFYLKAAPTVKQTPGRSTTEPKAHGLKSMGRNLWPKGKVRPRWWLALYEKI